jgi:cell division protein FtsN
MIEKHLKSLLHEHDCVVLPGFGGFITHTVPAEIHPIRHTFVPSYKNVAFNEKLKIDDGLLIDALVQDEGLTQHEAAQQVKEYVFELKRQIKEKNKYHFEELGNLYINHEYRLKFEAENKINFNNNSFGLPELYCKPVIRESGKRLISSAADKPAMPAKARDAKPNTGRRRSALWALVLFPVAAAVVVGAFIMLSKVDNMQDLGQLNPFAMFDNPVAENNQGPTAEELEQQLLADQYGENVNADLEEDGVAEEVAAVETPVQENPASSTPVETTNVVNNIPAATPAPPVSTTPAKAETTTEKEAPAKAEQKVAESPKPDISTAPSAPKAGANIADASAKEQPVATETQPAPKAGMISGPLGRYYIIAGGFSTQDNAQKLITKLTKKGLDAKVIAPVDNKGLYKVSLGDYNTADEARLSLDTLKPEYGNEIWIFKY